MTYQDFKNKWNGKGCDFDNYYGFQCMDLAEQYNKDVVGANRIGGNAKDAVNNYDRNKYSYIVNTPTGVPSQGDIIVWGVMPGNAYGHIAIYDNGNVNDFVSLDQNWPVGSLTHLQSHNYNYVLGWLHPKTVAKNWDDVVQRMKNALNAGGTSQDRATNADKEYNK